MKVIDVSYHNGNIDFHKVRQDGIEGVIIRAGYGKGNLDTKYHQNIENAIKVGMRIGVYWFSYAYTVHMVDVEAKHCLRLLEPYRKYIDLPVFFDWEYDSYKYSSKNGVNPSKTLISDFNVLFCQIMRNAGYMAGYYLNLDYAKNYVDERQLKSYKRWFARYTDNPQTDCYMWQYTSNGKVNGISGKVDMNILYEDIKKPIDDIVAEVIKGYWGSGNDRRQRLTRAGYDYRLIQDLVNAAMKQLQEEKKDVE